LEAEVVQQKTTVEPLSPSEPTACSSRECATLMAEPVDEQPLISTPMGSSCMPKPEIEVILHVRGLSLSSRWVQEYVNERTMDSFAIALLNGERKFVSAPQFQLSTINQRRQIKARVYTKTFSSPLNAKRAVLIGTHKHLIQSMPFGFTLNLLNETRKKFGIKI
jgi:hypothetical protein